MSRATDVSASRPGSARLLSVDTWGGFDMFRIVGAWHGSISSRWRHHVGHLVHVIVLAGFVSGLVLELIHCVLTHPRRPRRLS